jgi:hypothetical protein
MELQKPGEPDELLPGRQWEGPTPKERFRTFQPGDYVYIQSTKNNSLAWWWTGWGRIHPKSTGHLHSVYAYSVEHPRRIRTFSRTCFTAHLTPEQWEEECERERQRVHEKKQRELHIYASRELDRAFWRLRRLEVAHHLIKHPRALRRLEIQVQVIQARLETIKRLQKRWQERVKETP